MRGNLSTDGLYDRAKRLSTVPQRTSRRSTTALATHLAGQNRDIEASAAPGTAATRQDLPLRTLPPVHFRRAPGSGVAISGPSKEKTLHVKSSQVENRVQKLPHSSRRGSSAPQAPVSQPRPVLPASCTDHALWIRPLDESNEGEPVVTYYSKGCKYSLIARTVAAKLGLRIIPCQPRLHLTILTEFGVVYPTEYVQLRAEAPWMKYGDLGKREVAVSTDGVLESRGIEFLAGERILQKKPAPSAYDAFEQGSSRRDTEHSLSNTSALPPPPDDAVSRPQHDFGPLRPAIDNLSPATPSNSMRGFQSPFCPSTTGLHPESTAWTSFGSFPNQSLADEARTYDCSSNTYETCHESLNGEARDIASFGYFDAQISAAGVGVNSSTSFSPSNTVDQEALDSQKLTPTLHSPELGQHVTEYSSPGANHQSLALESHMESFASQPQDNFISEDSSAIYQGMTDWTCLPLIRVDSPKFGVSPNSDPTMFP